MKYDSGRYRGVGHAYIVYDGIDLNDFFEVVGIGAPVSPTIEPITTTIPGKAGQHYYGRRVGALNLTFRLYARANEADHASVIQRWRELKPLIVKPEPKRLYVDDEMYLMAMLTGDTELEFLDERGAVEVTFTAFDPTYHGREHVIELKEGKNSFWVVSLDEVWPVIRVTGAQAPLQVRDNTTYKEVRVPAVGSATIEIRMEDGKVFANSNYVPVDMQYTDFFSLPPNEDAEIYLSSGSGTLTYEERA